MLHFSFEVFDGSDEEADEVVVVYRKPLVVGLDDVSESVRLEVLGEYAVPQGIAFDEVEAVLHGVDVIYELEWIGDVLDVLFEERV